jgi:hypothetical protein
MALMKSSRSKESPHHMKTNQNCEKFPFSSRESRNNRDAADALNPGQSLGRSKCEDRVREYSKTNAHRAPISETFDKCQDIVEWKIEILDIGRIIGTGSIG